MKTLLKLLLFLGILFAGVYAATPLWLPYILARQLPPGWQLEELVAGYPDFYGIDINVLGMKGEHLAVGLELTAADIRFAYRGKKTDIGALSLDVFIQASADGADDVFTLDDLSLPVIEFDGSLPGLSVSQMQVALHPAESTVPGKNGVIQPLVLDFQAFELLPTKDNGFHITTGVSIKDSAELDGWLEADVTADSRKAGIRFPAAADKASWLTASLEQGSRGLETNTNIHAVLDTEQVDQDWLDTILERASSGSVSHVSGKLEVQANFAGTELQEIKQLSLVTGQLQAEFNEETLNLDAELLASREGGQVNVTLNSAENIPLLYTSGDLVLKADQLFLETEVTPGDGELTSSGAGTFMNGHIEPLAASAARVDVSWQELDLLSLAGKFKTETQGFSADYDDETWTGFDFDVSYALLANTDVNGSGTVEFDAGPDIPIEFSGNAQTNQWNIRWPAATVEAAQLDGLLRAAHFELPESVELTDGRLEIQGEVVVGDEISARITIKGHDMGASMLESSARKAGFTLKANYDRAASASGPVSIETITLAGGIDVEHFRVDLVLENMETIGLNNLSAEVFEGRMNVSSLRFAENRFEDTTVELSNVNLGQLLAFADIDGLEGTGALGFSLPAGSDQAGVYIKNGTFSAIGPGRLAYTKEGMAAGNIGLQALENFQYDDLSGTIDYQSDGVYRIAVRLEGKNPDLYEGHPIVFNLTINGSLPELFEALFMTGDFEEAVLNQIRSE